MGFDSFQENCQKIMRNISELIIGNEPKIKVILSALLAGGHVLLEDIPGTGKTMLAKALSASFDCEFRRIQFAPDLMPSDLTGVNTYSPKTGEFSLRKGPVFTNILLTDEINRATPRTQAGLLECMEERQVTIDGVTYALDAPFFVIATQNPVEMQGTFPLSEAQVDRFMVRLSLGYPSHEESIAILERFRAGNHLERLLPVINKQELIKMQEQVKEIFVHKDIMDYIVNISEATRTNELVTRPVSIRAALALMHISMAYAAINGRGYVIPDDIQSLAAYVFVHRMGSRAYGQTKAQKAILEDILSKIKAPVEDWGRK